MNEKEILAHFDLGISKEIEALAHDKAFTHRVFVYRIGKQQYGYCTHCGSKFKTSGLRQSDTTECPVCKQKCMVRYAGLKRSRLIDEVYFTYFEKSIIDPKVLVAKGIYAVRDYSGDYHNVKTQFLVCALYVFKMGGAAMATRYGYYSMAKSMSYGKHFEIRKSVYSLDYAGHMANIRSYISKENIEAAVKNTQYQYSGWENYGENTLFYVKFFDMFSRWPCIEYITKLGLQNIVRDKLMEKPTYSAINWRGKTLQQVLALSRQDLKEIMGKGINIDALYIKVNRISKKEGSNLEPTQIHQIVRNYGISITRFPNVLKYTKLKKAIEYLQKQVEKNKKHFYYHGEAIITWDDYVKDCVTLGIDLTDESNLFPRDLYQAHQNTIKQVKIKVNELLNEKIGKRAKVLNKKYYFEHTGLLIRPVVSANELITEGADLHHCVGTYAKKYAEGKTDILVIRKQDELDKPFFTMEVHKNSIIQTRGKHNSSSDDTVKTFIKEFERQKLKKPEKETRVKIAV